MRARGGLGGVVRVAGLVLVVGCRAATPAPAPLADHAVAELGQAGLDALRRCDRAVGPELRAWGPGAALGVRGADLRAACGGAEAVLAARFEALGGRYREALQPLDGLARVAEDARVLALLLDEGERGPPLAAAVDHLRRALTDELPTMQRAAASPPAVEPRVTPEAVAGPELRARLAHLARSDAHDLGQLADLFDRHARQQSEARFVRRWSLRTAGAWAEATVARRRAVAAAWTASDADGQQALAALGPYLTACEALIAACQQGLAAYPEGAIPADEGAAALAALREAQAAWEVARQQALAAWGG